MRELRKSQTGNWLLAVSVCSFQSSILSCNWTVIALWSSPWSAAFIGVQEAGDLGAIEWFDMTLFIATKYQDAYLDFGDKDDSENRYTWGYQVYAALREKSGCIWTHKTLFRGNLQVITLQRIGIDVELVEKQRAAVTEAGEQVWVSDHDGVMEEFDTGLHWMLQTGKERGEVCLKRKRSM